MGTMNRVGAITEFASYAVEGRVSRLREQIGLFAEQVLRVAPTNCIHQALSGQWACRSTVCYRAVACL